ncbi:MAG TPA: hypothetical protein VGS22_16440 [Thermoanaerobaculia bacterium]|jgi:hypothetical protein|nr:hypothetical protein [Thermoanaerobaculia bacterium]
MWRIIRRERAYVLWQHENGVFRATAPDGREPTQDGVGFATIKSAVESYRFAAQLGSEGGKATSEVKAEASRRNGLLGGRPQLVKIAGRSQPFDAVVNLMDDDIRERLHSELAPCPPQKFVDAYLVAHREQFGSEFVFN